MKPLSADGSVGFPHVRVGHCQASNKQPHPAALGGVFYWMRNAGSPAVSVIVTRAILGPRPTASASAVQNGSPAVLSGIRVIAVYWFNDRV